MATVNSDSLIQLPDGQWVAAGVIAFFGGYQVSGDQVIVPDDTVVAMPGGGSMTAGAINSLSYSSNAPINPADGTIGPAGSPVEGLMYSSAMGGWVPNLQTALPIPPPPSGGSSGSPSGGTQSPGPGAGQVTPGTFMRGAGGLPSAASDLPEWAKAAFYNVTGLTWEDVAAGVKGGSVVNQAGTATTTSSNGLYYSPEMGGYVPNLQTAIPVPYGPGVDNSSFVYNGPAQINVNTGGTGGSLPGVPGVAGAGGTDKQRDAYALVAQTLHQFGLGGLADWAWSQIVSGASSNETILAMQGLDAWKQRFAGNELRAKAGLPPLDPSTYLQYEEQVRSLFRAHGLPIGFYDQASDVAYLIGQNVSPDELNARITQAYDTVATAPPAIRQAFSDYFGAQSDQALAAFVLDPDKARPVLLKQVQTAEVGGTGAQFGFNLSASRAGQLVDFGVDRQRALQGFSQIDQLRPLFSETISETKDLTAENQGVAAVFELPGDARQQLEKRREERAAAFGGATQGGAVTTRAGFVGLGEAR